MDLLNLTLAEFRTLIEQKKVQDLRIVFEEWHPADIAELCEHLTLEETLFLFKTINKVATSQVFSYLSIETQERLIEAFSGPQIKSLLEHVEFDDVVDFLEELPDVLVRKVLQNASESQRQEINVLLSYHPNSAGALITTRYVELNEADTLKDAIGKVRAQGKGAASIQTCFVVNQYDRLIGTALLKDMMTHNEDELVSDIMETDIISVNTKDDREEVVKIFSKYDLSVVPVVNDQFCLVGIITVDDVIDVIEEEATEDIQRMAAITPIDGSYLQTSVLEMFKSRIPWLLVLMISATMTGLVMEAYAHITIALTSLVIFIPMLMDTAGNAGSQASAMVIRGIAIDHLDIKDFFIVLFREMKASIVTGVILFVVNVIRILVFSPSISFGVAILVSLAIFITIVLANLIGGSLPLVALLIKVDPAAMAGPVITTLVDVVALIIYFNMAAFYLARVLT
ncbi:MAG: magnesium transporter [Erysipelotrichia bacterium]|jgi:magnesium transporter|nr:magnesium transporter [Erysipelotrichia bacterium]